MTHEALFAILDNIKILDRRFIATPTSHGWHLQVTYNETDIDTGKLEQQCSRKWFISDEATESDVVDTAFAAVMRSYDHVVQEHFTYKGKRVFSPHFTIGQRLAMATSCPVCEGPHDDVKHREVRKLEVMTLEQREQKQAENAVAGFEHWLHQDMFTQADELLMLYKNKIENWPPVVLLGILSITFPAKDRLKNHDDFLRRAEAKLRADLGDVRANDLLRHRR
jgi:hypothetical protein